MQYRNPVIRGFNPDPSICRVGKDYYLVTSSFEYFPGIPIYHSRDLVNWKQIGNCVQRAEEFPLTHVKDSGGIWAPSIRFHEGKFYVTATLEQYGNFIVSAEDPSGEWSGPVWVDVGGIDPSVLFDGEKVYYCTNQSEHPGREEITLEEIDIETGRLLTPPKAVWSGIGGGFLEAPHIYHIGEWYYILTAEGGTNFNHMITAGRSRSVWGPYEECPWNPVLTNVHDTSKEVQCSGHGDLVQDHRGGWWMVHLGIRLCRRTMSNLGRETFLTPVEWEDGWFFAGENKKAKLVCEGPLWKEQEESPEWRADLTSEKWDPEILFLRSPLKEHYRKTDRGLTIKPSAVSLSDGASPSLVVRRPFDFDCEMETEFLFEPRENGDEAGVVVMLSAEFHVELCIRRDEDGTFLVLRKRAEDMIQEAFREKAEDLIGKKLRMRIRADREKYSFYFGLSGAELQMAGTASTRFLCCELAGKCFTGTVWGLYAAGQRETAAELSVDSWSMKGIRPQEN